MTQRVPATNWFETVPTPRPRQRMADPVRAVAEPPTPAATAAITDTATAPRRSARRRLGSLLLLALVVASWFAVLRPAWLGGPASVVTIRGASMEPTYRYGDLVLLHHRPGYSPGDVVAFRVPDGEIGAGTVVIHRIIGGDATTGFVLQGDNNPEPDRWRPVPDDILGTAVLRIPWLGRLGVSLRSIPGIALLAGLAASLVVLVGIRDPSPPCDHQHPVGATATPSDHPVPDAGRTPPDTVPQAPAALTASPHSDPPMTATEDDPGFCARWGDPGAVDAPAETAHPAIFDDDLENVSGFVAA